MTPRRALNLMTLAKKRNSKPGARGGARKNSGRPSVGSIKIRSKIDPALSEKLDEIRRHMHWRDSKPEPGSFSSARHDGKVTVAEALRRLIETWSPSGSR